MTAAPPERTNLMVKDRYEEAPNTDHCGHPNQQIHDYPDPDSRYGFHRVVFCPACGREWS